MCRSPLKFIPIVAAYIFLLSSFGAAAANEAAKNAAWKTLLGSFEGIFSVQLLGVLANDSSNQTVPPAMLAHVFYVKRHFDLAAFYFKIDYDLNPDHVESLSNLAALLVELNASDPKKYSQKFVDWAVMAAQKTVALKPDDPGLQNNLSFVLQAAAELTLETQPEFASQMLDGADKAARRATALEPERGLQCSVVSICVPGICVHIRIKNGNEADIRFEAGPSFGPIKVVAGADGHFSNKNSFTVDRLTSSTKFSLYNRSAAGNLAGKHTDISPAEIKIFTTEGEAGEKLDGTVMGFSLITF